MKKHLLSVFVGVMVLGGTAILFLNSCNKDCVHSWSEWHIVEEADCTKEGVKQRECSICGDKENIAYLEQNHTYSSEWTYDSTSHWHTAVCEHTNEKNGTSVHVIENNICKICGFAGTEGLSYTFTGAGFYTVDGIGSSTETDIFIPARYNDGVHGDAPVGTVNYNAFNGNTSLKRVRVPDSVTMIGNAAFRDCTALEEIILPDSITKIYSSAFYGCASITGITLPSNLVYMGTRLFEGCSALETIVIPNGVTAIEMYTFYGCNSLASVTFGESLTSIGDYAFSFCDSLTTIILPLRIMSIGYLAFYCENLESVVFENSSNWDIADDEYGNSVIKHDINLSDKTINARYLKQTYCGYWWKCNRWE